MLSPVIALTIVAGRSMARGLIGPDTQILVVVRRPDTNSTHPNVISVPTQRVPEDWFASVSDPVAALPEYEFAADEEATNLELTTRHSAGDGLPSGHDPVVYSVEALLARKLGLADALEDDSFQFCAVPRVIVEGRVHYDSPNLYGAEEGIRMTGVLVVVHAGADRVPPNTRSYSRIEWVEARALIQSIASRDPSSLEAGFDAFQHCIHGLCISACAEIITHDFGELGESHPLTRSNAKL
jgi:hypothetical protein